MNAPLWMEKEEVLVIHDMQLAEHGGAEGFRNESALKFALMCPRDLRPRAGKDVSLTAMAAAYAFGIAMKLPFVDGNKRTALVVTLTFLELNGIEIRAPQEDIFLTFWLLLTPRDHHEEGLKLWLDKYSAKVDAD